jgi:hypothetical protein
MAGVSGSLAITIYQASKVALIGHNGDAGNFHPAPVR